MILDEEDYFYWLTIMLTGEKFLLKFNINLINSNNGKRKASIFLDLD